MLEGGSLVGNESARVLSCACSRRCLSRVSPPVTWRAAGSRPDPVCSRSFGVICGLPCFSCTLCSAIAPLLQFRCVELRRGSRGLGSFSTALKGGGCRCEVARRFNLELRKNRHCGRVGQGSTT